jgi:hypothetical protein
MVYENVLKMARILGGHTYGGVAFAPLRCCLRRGISPLSTPFQPPDSRWKLYEMAHP